MRFGLNFLAVCLLVLTVCFSFPSVSFAAKTEQLYPVADGEVYAFSYRNWNWANAGKSVNMGAGWHPAGGEKRAYLRFELSADVVVGRAVLKLYQNHSAGPVHELGVYRVTGPWEEGSQTYHSGQVEAKAKPGELCWMQQPAFDTSPEAVFMSASSIPAWTEVDITALVRKWQAGESNCGLVIKTTLTDPTSSDPEAKSQFATRESTDPNHRPVLVIFQDGQDSGPRQRVEARTMDTTTCEQVPGTLAVPEGQAAVNFRIERLDGCTQCHSQTHPVKIHAFVIFDPGVMTVYTKERARIGLPPWPVWPPMPRIEITEKEMEFSAYHFPTSRALAVVFHYIRETNKPISEFPQSLKDLVLGPGKYQLHVGQGRQGGAGQEKPWDLEPTPYCRG
ncbi:MAG TPA: DNRLRE domain-containing protein [Candidatus Aminicenantes bacterium]|nr:DNRLRE domain-containing protein [Candidatus Aminicenantes bacterium]